MIVKIRLTTWNSVKCYLNLIFMLGISLALSLRFSKTYALRLESLCQEFSSTNCVRIGEECQNYLYKIVYFQNSHILQRADILL